METVKINVGFYVITVRDTDNYVNISEFLDTYDKDESELWRCLGNSKNVMQSILDETSMKPDYIDGKYQWVKVDKNTYWMHPHLAMYYLATITPALKHLANTWSSMIGKQSTTT